MVAFGDGMSKKCGDLQDFREEFNDGELGGLSLASSFANLILNCEELVLYRKNL